MLRVFILVFFIGQSMMSMATATTSQRIDDEDITLAVETELAIDTGVPSHYIDVETNNGIVLLSGMVDNLLARERARQRAELVKGVRAVVNNLVVKPVERSDEAILADVKQALMIDPATDAYNVLPSVKDGVVTLTGAVDSWQEKQLCQDVVQSVKGVKDVHNEMSVTVKETRPDQEIATDIKRRLAADVWVGESLLTVDVQDGKVTLQGIVGSAMEKSRAVRDAWVVGVQSVDASPVEIKWWEREKMQQVSPFTPKTDADIAQAVSEAFYYDPRVSVFNPRVKVAKGVVTLTGVVDDMAAKQAAAEDAQNTKGVWRVQNHLRVRPATLPSNDDIAKRVRDALARDPYIERYEPEVTVLNGRVYLAGTVDSLFEKTHATHVTERVNGVVDVVNNLQVLATAQPKSDWEIKLDIERAFRQSPLIPDEAVAVSVEGGVVTLSGTVDTWLEHNIAVTKAYGGGASSIRDRLQVTNGPEDFRS
jgi:osmotically-inducible protein OsmY